MSQSIRRLDGRLWPRVATAAGVLLLVAAIAAGIVWRNEIATLAASVTGAGTPDGENSGGYPGSAPLGGPEDESYPGSAPLGGPAATDAGHDDSSHEDHGHSHGGDTGHAAHDDHSDHAAHDASMLTLSTAAEKNLGIVPLKVTREPYEVHESIPAFVTERPGRTHFNLPAPTTGIVTEVAVVPGQVVQPGEKLFSLRVTHEDLVEAQAALLQTAEQLVVVGKEIARLESVTEGVVARKQILEQQYEKQKLEAIQRAQSQRLELLGLTQQQIDNILETRRLLSSMTVYAPERTVDGDSVPYHLHTLDVQRGQFVNIGQSLAELADYRLLYIEGLGFGDDGPALVQAKKNDWPVSAIISQGGGESEKVDDLHIVYLADTVDRQSRALKFYVELPNVPVADREARSEGDIQFASWKYRPGQQVELRVPTEYLPDQLVVPIEAIAIDGAETYVFKRHVDSHGPHYDRVAVHVVRRDQRKAILDPKGPIKAGDTIAGRGAYQMHLALRNAAGGGMDPHAGHSH